jgi:hypothetical protein
MCKEKMVDIDHIILSSFDLYCILSNGDTVTWRPLREFSKDEKRCEVRFL